jgi:hypothetical protein
MDHLVKENLLLKLEIEKKEFINFFTERLQAVDVQNTLYDVVFLLVQSSEEKFYKQGKRLGDTKKAAVLGVLQKVLKSSYNEGMLTGMIESILTNNDVRRSPWYVRLWRYIKYRFRKPSKQ